MGFFEGLGNFLGQVTAKAEQMQEQINLYRGDYEYMSNEELMEEGRRLQSLSGQTNRAKLMAVKTILKERGVLS